MVSDFLFSNLAKQPSVNTTPEQLRGLEVVPLQQQWIIVHKEANELNFNVDSLHVAQTSAFSVPHVSWKPVGTEMGMGFLWLQGLTYLPEPSQHFLMLLSMLQHLHDSLLLYVLLEAQVGRMGLTVPMWLIRPFLCVSVCVCCFMSSVCPLISLAPCLKQRALCPVAH